MGETKPFFLAIEGPIGVGKTTLATLLSRVWQTELTLERFANNPFLPLFYTNRAEYALQTQLYFLLDRFDQWSELPPIVSPSDQTVAATNAPRSLVSDYLFDKDRIFAELTLNREELRRYLKVFEALRTKLVSPTHLIYLRADVPTLLAHISKRARSFETGIDAEYMTGLSQAYDTFFADYKGAPVLRLDTHELDEVARKSEAGPDETALPQNLISRLEAFVNND